MLVHLDDDLCVRYQAMAPTQPLAQILGRQLARFADYPATVRIVPLARDALQQIEHLLGGGQIATGTALESRIRDYASITLGQITLDLSAAQKAELVHRAAKRGMTPDALAHEMVDTLLDQLFEVSTPYR